jgi:hypothetical protein
VSNAPFNPYQYFWSVGNIDNVIYTAIIISLTLVEVHYGVLRRLLKKQMNFSNDIVLGPLMRRLPGSQPKLVPLIPIASSAVVTWFWLSLVFLVHYNMNLQLVRVANFVVAAGAGHFFAWLAIAAIVTRWGWDNIVQGGLIVGVYSALHEFYFYVFYTAAYFSEVTSTLVFYLPFNLLTTTMCVCYYVLVKKQTVKSVGKERIFQVLIILTVFNAMCLIGGYPVTVSTVTGPGPLFFDLPTNILENIGWVLPALPLIVPTFAELAALKRYFLGR